MVVRFSCTYVCEYIHGLHAWVRDTPVSTQVYRLLRNHWSVTWFHYSESKTSQFTIPTFEKIKTTESEQIFLVFDLVNASEAQNFGWCILGTNVGLQNPWRVRDGNISVMRFFLTATMMQTNTFLNINSYITGPYQISWAQHLCFHRHTKITYSGDLLVL